jgi:lauroyl-KDO2-lipid IV(A) myristoyltransferase
MSDAAAQLPALPRRLLHPRFWPQWAAVAAAGALQWLPRRWRDGLGGVIGDVQYRANAKRRGTVELNLALCFADWREADRQALARAHFRAYARAMLDQAALWLDRGGRVPRRLCRVHGRERILAERRAGRSVILIEPHTTAVDFGGIALTPDVALSTMGNELTSPLLDWLVQRTRARYGVIVFRREDGLRPVVRALKRGTVFYYMPDEDFGRANSVFAPFFGRSKATLTTVGRLARASGAAVVPIYAYYRPEAGRYEVVVGEALSGFPSGDAEADAARVNAAMEAGIRQRPEAYLWNYRLFRTRPDGSRMRYPKHGRRKRRRRKRQRRRERGEA